MNANLNILDADRKYNFSLLSNAKLSYLTLKQYQQLKEPGLVKAICESVSGIDNGQVVSCTVYARLLARSIRHNQDVIRHINSKSSTDKLAYANWYQVPGTHNYTEIFHYHHVLTPDDKHRVKSARYQIHACRNTDKLYPDESSQAPVYWIPDKSKLWQYQLIMIEPLLKAFEK